ncbi:MAG TPA: hypothetical protein VGE21_09760 [Flavobacteriales bacterium]
MSTENSPNEIELLENLIESAAKVSYDSKDQFDVLERRTEMIIRKLFGEKSHYLEDLKGINYTPRIVIGGGNTDWRGYFERGLKQFRNLLAVMLEDKKLSTNYSRPETTAAVAAEEKQKVSTKALKEIRVLIASPGDVAIERELLLDKLETKFRRDHYEERCGARIIVEGWEVVASQTGYPQDIINSDLVAKANIILAVFRHKLGSPTIDLKTGKDRAASGTAEELLYAIRNKEIANPPLGMAYFYANAPVISLDSIDFTRVQEDWDRLKQFRNEIKNEILYKSYSIEESILDVVAKDLCDNIIKYFK